MDSPRYKDWYGRASQDLRGASILLEYGGGNELVAFHCQQAIEKQMKGWLLKATGELTEGHSLVFLCRKAIAAGAPVRAYLRDCAYVNQFYLETRYPADVCIPVSDEEARDCIEIATQILSALSDSVEQTENDS